MKKFPDEIDIKNKHIVMQPYKTNFEEFNYIFKDNEWYYFENINIDSLTKVIIK